MSNNQYFEPPKLTPANDLLAQLANVPQATKKEESPAPTGTAETPELDAPETAESTPLPEPVSAAEVIGEAPETDTTENNYGGAWGIIKYTGYVRTLLWAILTAAVTGATAYYLTPGEYTWISLTILGFLTGGIAAIDQKTFLIKNEHTLITAILLVPMSIAVAFTLGPWNFLFGVISALLIFGSFVFLVLKVGFGSGGDIKFSPIPAFALGIINPLIPLIWMFLSLVITAVFLAIKKAKATSFGEGMAISLPLSIAIVAGLYSLSGMPYL